jgi:hypothetical protein
MVIQEIAQDNCHGSEVNIGALNADISFPISSTRQNPTAQYGAIGG